MFNSFGGKYREKILSTLFAFDKQQVTGTTS